ncbi:MAG TPA: hypothetical protein VHG28_00615 [Longimicrobiaceae bacterium]|nr:hypothetical protein [Longimicrobiaceae bacterium]
MFGLEILDIIIGLFFVYLLLSLVCTAINEYIAALLNLRGRHLVQGIQRLLEDTGETDVSGKFFEHRLIRSLYAPSLWGGKRKPSYIPARTFAMALLDVAGFQPGAGGAATRIAGYTAETAPTRPSLADVIDLLKQDAVGDVAQFLTDVGTIEATTLPDPVKRRLAGAVSGTRTEFQKLHDSVEVWFNNAMDRVSGAYKRTTQILLLVIGLVVACATNADTIQIWRTLAVDDELRNRLAQQVVARFEAMQQDTSTLGAGLRPRTPSQDSARALYAAARAELDSLQLRLGWTRQEAAGLGILQAGRGASPEYRLQWPWRWRWGAAQIWSKLVGLLITATALSLGAPFWFDALNKVINVRAAGRAPDEKAKSPEAPGKRPAEVPTK